MEGVLGVASCMVMVKQQGHGVVYGAGYGWGEEGERESEEKGGREKVGKERMKKE